MNRRDWQTQSCLRRRNPQIATPYALCRRHSFSLLEILVVLGIIAFLTAAIVVVLPRLGNTSKIAATQATIKTVDELLNDRINGFQRWISKQDQAGGTGVPQYVLQAGTYSGNSLPVAKILAIKRLFAQAFPQQFFELSAAPSYSSPQAAANHKAVTESAACLYIILTQQAIFDTEPPAGADLKGVQVADTDNDGYPEIVDAWGQPLRFYRWPTRLTRPNYSPPPTTSTGFIEAPPPTPLSLAMSGAAPRAPLAQWAANTVYSVGTTVLPPPPAQVNPFSLVYLCTAAVTPFKSGGTPPTWPASVGTTVSDNNLTWQAVVDPLSVDLDDPSGLLGLLPGGAVSVVSEVSSAIGTPIETPSTWSIPLIVSAGSDGLLGLFEPSSPAWQASTQYAVGANVTPTTANGHTYSCTLITGLGLVGVGVSGSGQPSWPTTPGATVTDGGVQWTADIGGTLAAPMPVPAATAADPTGLRSAMYDNITNHQK